MENSRKVIADRILKSYGILPKNNTTIEKSEGSRGGKVIGHTKSGKPIYEKHEQEHTQHYTAEDHSDAVTHHMKESKKHSEEASKYDNSKYREEDHDLANRSKKIHSDKSQHHSSMAQLHSQAMNAKMDKKAEETKKSEDIDLEKSEQEFLLNKSFDILSYNGVLNEEDILIKGGSPVRSSLMAQKVQVKHKDGTTTWAIRWKGNDHDNPHEHSHKKFQGDNHHSKIEGASHEEKIQNVTNSNESSTTKLNRLVGLGIYDSPTLQKLAGVTHAQAYETLYTAGVKGKDFKDEHDKLRQTDDSNSGSSTETGSSDGGESKSPVLKNGKMSFEDAIKHVQDIDEAEEKLSKGDFERFVAHQRKQLVERDKEGFEGTEQEYSFMRAEKGWELYKDNLERLVTTGDPSSIIVYGKGGIGKSYTLESTFFNPTDDTENPGLGLREYDPEIHLTPDDYDVVVIKGSADNSYMYNMMHKHNGKIIVFDDCDSVWKSGNDDGQNLMKGALDTGRRRQVGFPSARSSDLGGEEKYKAPSSFDFRGQIVFISNLKSSELPQPIIDSRSTALDLTMSKEQTLAKLESIAPKMKRYDKKGEAILFSKEDRQMAIDYMKENKNFIALDKVNARKLGELMGIAYNLSLKGKLDKKEFLTQANKQILNA